MPKIKETRLRLLPYNYFFQDQVLKMRFQLGLPPNGVPSNLTQTCERWLKRRGMHPSGGFWPLNEYLKRALNPSEWEGEIWGLRRSDDWGLDIQPWLNGVIRAYGVPERTAPIIMEYVISNDLESLKRSCKDLKTPNIGVTWNMTDGIVVTLEGVDADISQTEWTKIYERLKPEVSKERHGTLDVDSSPSRERPNLERDIALFVSRYSGMTIQEAVDQWCNQHPEDSGELSDTGARLAIDAIIDLMTPHEEWMVTIQYDEKGTPNYKSGGREEFKDRFKQWLTEQAEEKRRALDNPLG